MTGSEPGDSEPGARGLETIYERAVQYLNPSALTVARSAGVFKEPVWFEARPGPSVGGSLEAEERPRKEKLCSRSGQSFPALSG